MTGALTKSKEGERRVNINEAHKLDVSIVIPAYNEEESIAMQIKAVREVMDKADWTYEVIVVDDGSTDDTAQKVVGQEAKLISLPQNHGYGAALKIGINEAQAEWIVIIDADGTYPCTAIPELLDMAHKYDMVVGARIGENVHIPFLRKPAKWLLNMLANYLSGRHIPDLNSGLRVLKKSIVKRFMPLLPSGFSFTTSITLALLCNDYLVMYHPVDYYRRIGNSKIRSVDAYHFLLLILRTITYYNPIKIFLPLGGIFFLGGMSKFIYDIVTVWNLSESAIMGFLAAGIIWAIGLLADLIVRISFIERLK